MVAFQFKSRNQEYQWRHFIDTHNKTQTYKNISVNAFKLYHELLKLLNKC